MLITTTGAGILIRTNVVTENGNDGIEIGGAATGVQVAGNIIGADQRPGCHGQQTRRHRGRRHRP